MAIVWLGCESVSSDTNPSKTIHIIKLVLTFVSGGKFLFSLYIYILFLYLSCIVLYCIVLYCL